MRARFKPPKRADLGEPRSSRLRQVTGNDCKMWSSIRRMLSSVLVVESRVSEDWSQNEQSEPKGFSRTNAGGNGGTELCAVSDGEIALELDGAVCAVRSA